PEELEAVKEAAGSVAVFRSANMSLGVALLAGLAKKAAALMPDADVEIVETHHNRKLDAPSGTALMLAEEIKKARDGASVTCGRSGMSPRKKGEIGISSVRRGNIVGIHEIIFSTGTESITLKHEAHDRALFADGALSAARFLAGKPAGLYGMSDLVAAGD
ncbi:MAG: 4-hydroxy-tetrahydrodipicolinate reductase, partial [Clostridia bacterium]|nr:4-hydroxy-tetrahydrodipicolinate reductase [Clostridia bacterium]